MWEAREQISRLYARGAPMEAIAQDTGLTVRQVGSVLTNLRGHHRRALTKEAGERVLQAELAKIDELERTAWEHFIRSATPDSVLPELADPASSSEERLAMVRKHIDKYPGDTRYLAHVEWCITMRLRVHGLLAAQQGQNVMAMVSRVTRIIVTQADREMEVVTAGDEA